ncbi:MAG: choice-of-anchor D domain-containing protein [Cytophagales bacterium]|nr:MAG: choice-of-anchor D domain-containing protein [Cytophagales bacterium]TAF60975.1 MAG: choice-of-anchor D domain-containing protein [Cytophagales bacterium]
MRLHTPTHKTLKNLFASHFLKCYLLVLFLGGCQNPDEVCPELSVSYLGQSIQNGGVLKVPSGIINITQNFVFEVQNTGGAVLKIGEISSNNLQTSVTQIATNRLNESQKSTFGLAWTPNKLGTQQATISFANNDFDENPFVFSIELESLPVPKPEIALRALDTDIQDDVTVLPMASIVAGSSGRLTVTVQNLGGELLNLGAIRLSNPIFRLSKELGKTVLQPSESTTFEVLAEPTSADNYECTVSLDNNDENENPFSFKIILRALPIPTPDISVIWNTSEESEIPNGYTITINLLQSFNERLNFSIRNVGAAPLTISRVETCGDPAFTAKLNNPKKLAPGESTSMDVTVSGIGSLGERNCDLKIFSDDPDENPFIIKLKLQLGKPRLTIDFESSELPEGINTVPSDSGPNRTLFLANFKVNDPENLVDNDAELVINFRFSNGAGGTTRRRTTDGRTGKIAFDAAFDNMDYFTSIRFGNDSDFVEFAVYLETKSKVISNQEKFIINKPLGANREKLSSAELK